MPRPRGSARVPGSGRKKGTPNRATVSLKEAFRRHGPELVERLMELTGSDDPRVRISAIREALDRSFYCPCLQVLDPIQ